MSPRRMDISSLLRDPSPPPRPRTIDALLHHPQPTDHPPASLLSLLNPRPPFLGLDALVHVASEERQRITALVHHDRPPAPFQDRPHKRPRDTCPSRSPSPEPTFPLLPASPSTRHHPSANSYPTLRRQPILYMEPARSVPADTRTISLQHTSPILHSPRSSPRNNSPRRHSPQHLRSHHHSSPVQSGPHMEADAMSPRYGYGPRMAGGIQVLSNDPPRPDFSTYHSPGRDNPTDHAKLSPLFGRAFALDDDRHHVKPPSYQLEAPEALLPRERVRPRPPHWPPVDPTTDNAKIMHMPAKEAAQPPLERHPIRVWEEHPTAREASRRVSPAPTVCGLAEGPPWPESGHGERPAKEDQSSALRQDVVEDVPTPPLSTCKEPPPPHDPTPDPLASGPQTPIEETCLDLQPTPMQPRSPIQSESLFLNSSALRAPASPVLDLHLKNFETQSELRPERPETQVNASTSVPPTSSDPIVPEPVLAKAELVPAVVDADASLMADPLPRQPSPEPVQPVLALELGTFTFMSTHSTDINVSQNTSRSPSQRPLPLLPAKEERNPPPEDILISPPAEPEPPSRRSPEPEYATEREPSISEQAMMDVDEELLSLIEDRPVRAVPAMPKAQIDSTLPLLIRVGEATGAGAEQGSDGLSSLVPSFKDPLLITDEEKDRASMPPPAARSKKAGKDKTTLAAGTATGTRKKKDGTSKPATKPKQPPKPRAKPVPKPKAKPNVVDTSSKAGIPKSAVNVNARSRSTSVIPVSVDDVVPEPEVDESDKEDDKLYCVCKTRYDEDRMMIACDRCDEWFHTLCVDMQDLEIDLVDQFICPPCIQKHPHLRTTWKRRCLFGLQHENPSSPEACHKPSRGVFSKYCSDDCGIKYMRTRIARWEKSGGGRDLLWESVKNAAKREGVVCAVTNGAGPRMMDVNSNNSELKPLESAAKRRAERDVARLNARLGEVVKERELMKRELDMVMWREIVVELASERAGKVDACGWDQRLCFGEEEWADFGPEVLESYEEERVKVEPRDDAIPRDAASGEWWCTGKKRCQRHAGWQKLRAAEVSFDKETKEGILLKLTTREREIRKCIEDILYPQPTDTLQALPHPEIQLNGSEKPPSTGHVSERRKKRSL